jgi:hypothetical protein
MRFGGPGRDRTDDLFHAVSHGYVNYLETGHSGGAFLGPISKGDTALVAGRCNRRLWQFFKLGILNPECGEDFFSASNHLQLSANARPNKLIHPRKPEEVVSLRDNKSGRLLIVGGGLQCRRAHCVTGHPERRHGRKIADASGRVEIGYVCLDVIVNPQHLSISDIALQNDK